MFPIIGFKNISIVVTMNNIVFLFRESLWLTHSEIICIGAPYLLMDILNIIVILRYTVVK